MSHSIELKPIGYVRNSRREPTDDFWGDVVSEIVLDEALPTDALDGIEEFSHIEVIFCFDRVDPAKIVMGARHPRNNLAWPKVGIFAQRGKNRPNRLGATLARLVSREGRRLVVTQLDAIDGTPVLDIKPVLREFLPKGPVGQPAWATELMADYWNEGEAS